MQLSLVSQKGSSASRVCQQWKHLKHCCRSALINKRFCILADEREISVVLRSVYKKLCAEEKGQRQLKIMGYCKAQEEAIAQLLTLQLLAAEAALMFWQHSWVLYMLTGDQGNISVLTTLSIVESIEEKNKDALTNLHCTRRACFSMATSCRMYEGICPSGPVAQFSCVNLPV